MKHPHLLNLPAKAKYKKRNFDLSVNYKSWSTAQDKGHH